MKNSILSNFKLRTITGFIYALIIIVSIFLGYRYFISVLIILTVLAFSEYLKFLFPKSANGKIIIFSIVAGISFLPLILLKDFVNYESLFWISLFYIIVICGYIFFLKYFTKAIFHLAFGLFWIFVSSFVFTLLLVNNSENIYLMLVPVVLAWINDTFAYLGGILIGRNKLIPRLSPHKTVEGLITGIVFTLIASSVFFYIIKQSSFYSWLLAGLFISVSAVFGDLVESIIKRHYNAKDSGHILPGHGGILDRIDSFLIVFPVVTIIFKFLF